MRTLAEVGEDQASAALHPERYGDMHLPWSVLIWYYGSQMKPDLIALKDFYARLEDQGLLYRHEWKPNQLLIFDNISLVHSRSDLSLPFPVYLEDLHRGAYTMPLPGVTSWETHAVRGRKSIPGI